MRVEDTNPAFKSIHCIILHKQIKLKSLACCHLFAPLMISSIGTNFTCINSMYWGLQQSAICMCVAQIGGTNLVLQIIHNSAC